MDSSPVAADVPRKRPRSQTESAQEAATTYKRGASEDLVMRSSPEAPQATSSTNADIDAYMADQGESDPPPLDVIEQTASQLPTPPSAPAPHEQLMSIQALKSKALAEGDVWFLVSKAWYTRWEDACTGRVTKESSGPVPLGPIDNTDITEVDPYPGKEYDLVLEPPVVEGETCEFLPKMAHEFLEQWLGPAKYPYEYTVTRTSPGSPQLTIEIYPRRIRVYRVRPSESFPPTYISVSRNLTLAQLLDQFDYKPGTELYRTEPDRPWGDTAPLSSIDFWNQTPAKRKALVSREPAAAQLRQTVADALLENHDSVLVRATAPQPGGNANATATAAAAASSSSDQPIFGQGNDYFSKLGGSTTQTTGASSSTAVTLRKDVVVKNAYKAPPRIPGTVGLANLGNTCFMNSALQCLAHLPELTEYFMRDVYKTELNPDNPLSTGGILARSYNDLVRNLFSSSSSSSYSPRDFKHKIATHAPQFSGYAQHDSQELVAFLLDGLHEDLNRVLKKPYVEKPEWEGGGSKEFLKLATDSWDGYIKRNDSVIVDLFQGQYKSTLVCPECKKVSITFDPFMYLTLPLPIKKTWSHEIFYIPWDPEKPNSSTTVELPYNSSIRTLKQKLATIFYSDATRMFATDFWHGKWYKVYSEGDMVSDINANDKTVVYELPIPLSETATSEKPNRPLILPLYHVVHEEATARMNSFNTYRKNAYNNDDKFFGMPTLVLLDQSRPLTEEAVYNTVLDQYRRWTSRAEHLYNWEAPDVDVPGDVSQETKVDHEELPNGHADPSPESQTSTAADAAKDIEAEVAEPELVFIGPKPNLFKVSVRDGPDANRPKLADVISASYEGSRTVAWADRRVQPEPTPDVNGLDITETVTDPSEVDDEVPELTTTDDSDKIVEEDPTSFSTAPVQLKPSDILRCEWDPHTLEYYFGPQGKGDGALWERFTPYTDAAEAAAREANAEVRLRDAKKNITLEDCLDEFTKEELLGEDDLWYCPKCKKHQQATKQFQIWKVPDVLVVHLKRFSNSRSLRDKIDAMVEFPIEGLDLSDRVGEKLFGQELEKETGTLEGTGLELVTHEPVIYDLFGVDEHMGGLGGGHYRAYALNKDDNQWYHYDDSHVSKAQASDAINSNAYLLFYRRRSTKPIGGKTYDKLEAARLAAPTAESKDTPDGLAPSSSQVTLASSASTSSLARPGSPMIGPVLPGDSTSRTRPDHDLPSFEQSESMGDVLTMTMDTLDDAHAHSRPLESWESISNGFSAGSGGSSPRRLALSDDSDDEHKPWIRRIGGGDTSPWSPTFRPGAPHRLSDASDMVPFAYNSMDQDETVEIDITPAPFD